MAVTAALSNKESGNKEEEEEPKRLNVCIFYQSCKWPTMSILSEKHDIYVNRAKRVEEGWLLASSGLKARKKASCVRRSDAIDPGL